MARRPLIAGNWKMHGHKSDSFDLVAGLLAKRGNGPFKADLLLCPPATLLDRVGQQIAGSDIWLGAQDCHSAVSGAFTGDIAAAMIKDMGASHVIVGHSERRSQHFETDAMVRAKAEAALAAGLSVIVCVGESAEQRAAGQALSVVTAQLKQSLPPGAQSSRVVIAYEPVWAIGSGQTPTLAEVAEVHLALRHLLASEEGAEAAQFRLLYGGSVTPANAAQLLALAEVDGALVGGASLKPESFWAIALASPDITV
jgi:triosephosphate isomerase